MTDTSDEPKIASVTVRALMLVEFTHQSAWSPTETFENAHRSAVREMELAILQNFPNAIKRMRLVKIEASIGND